MADGGEVYQGNESTSISMTQRGKQETDGEATDCRDLAITIIGIILIILFFPLALCMGVCRIAQEYERAVIMRLGRLRPGVRGPGVIFVIPCIDEYRPVDLRTVCLDFKPQKILTNDSVTCTVDGVVFYKIVKTRQAALCTGLPSIISQVAQTAIRAALTSRTLSNILKDRKKINAEMQKMLDKKTLRFGVKIQRVEIKDIKLPHELQRSLATEAETSRRAKAAVITADAEKQASRAFKEAADVMNESPGAIQLRQLQTMVQTAGNKKSTILFPIPMDFQFAKNFN